MARLYTANDIINRVAAEVGLIPVTDPYSSDDFAFQQLVQLLDSAGQELVELHQWQILTKQETFTTVDTDTGEYDLPLDFAYMIDQTGWDRTNDNPLFGPLSAQDWTYLLGRDLVSHTIYASFRLLQNKLFLFPQPPPDGLEINYEYISRNWVSDAQEAVFDDKVNTGDDIILYEPILIIKYLKIKFLEAKSFDSTAAAAEFGRMFDSRTGRDTGAQIINAGGGRRDYPYLTSWYNLPDTGYGN